MKRSKNRGSTKFLILILHHADVHLPLQLDSTPQEPIVNAFLTKTSATFLNLAKLITANKLTQKDDVQMERTDIVIATDLHVSHNEKML